MKIRYKILVVLALVVTITACKKDFLDDLFSERDPEEKVWGSMVKQTLKRRKPGFNERYHGFRSFSELLEQMKEKNMVTLELDTKSGGYIVTDYVGS